MSDFWGPNLLFLGPGLDSNNDFGPTHENEQISFSMISSILTFQFGLIMSQPDYIGYHDN